jgi:3-hydroxybutyryl-CoA dehydrogenase
MKLNVIRRGIKMKKIFVIGSGIMGSGIAQSCAQSGHHVAMIDVNEDALEKAMETITWSLRKLAEKDKLNEPHEDIITRIEKSKTIESGRNADLVIEAISENLEAKQMIFKALGETCSDQTIFASNTSSLPITAIANVVKLPERFVGIHFFNPVHRMKLVEIIRGLMTSDAAVDFAKNFALSLGKEPVVVNQDIAGFIVNRINGMAFLEALRLLEKGIASVEDIDKAMRLGLGHPMGPFELMDLVGLDIVLNARLGIYNETRNPVHYPPQILRRMVNAGLLGRKAGKGFYDYST